MKKIKLLPAGTLLAGAIGLGLRLWLLRTGVDDRGMLMADHPAPKLIWVLTALVLIGLALYVRPLAPMDSYRKLFPFQRISALGCYGAAVGILFMDIQEATAQPELITTVTLLAGILAAVCLVVLGCLRWQGKRPSYLLQSAVTVYGMLHLVSQYRLWSAEPQLLVYVFPLLASVLIMLAAYHGAVLDAGKGSRRWFVFFNQAALYFCLLALPGESFPFYAAMALWLLTGLCSLEHGATQAPQEEA